MSKPGRNDPCPCGSDKKYKQCCLAAEQQRRTLALNAAQPGDSGDKGAAAVKRYRTNAVKDVEQMSTQGGGGGGGSH